MLFMFLCTGSEIGPFFVPFTSSNTMSRAHVFPCPYFVDPFYKYVSMDLCAESYGYGIVGEYLAFSSRPLFLKFFVLLHGLYALIWYDLIL